MYKSIVFVMAVVVASYAAPKAEPGVVAAAYAAAPGVAPAVVTATSSQVIARNYNGFAAPFVAAPVAFAAPVHAAQLVGSPFASYVAAPAAYL